MLPSARLPPPIGDNDQLFWAGQAVRAPCESSAQTALQL